MSQKSSVEIVAVWFVTGVGNIIAQSVSFLEYLPIIKELLAIFSILFAISYTAYMFKKNWVGWLPKRNKKSQP